MNGDLILYTAKKLGITKSDVFRQAFGVEYEDSVENALAITAQSRWQQYAEVGTTVRHWCTAALAEKRLHFNG